MAEKEVWIGLVEMIRRPGKTSPLVDEDADGFFCHVLAWASNPEDYHAIVRRAASDYELDVGEVDDLEPLRTRREREPVNQVLIEKAKEVEMTHGIRFDDVIYSYPPEDSRSSDAE